MSSSTAAPTPESKLATLKAAALKAYSQKDYAVSAELYASACELQSTIHGENNPQNAHLLYLYGRSLFEVAVKKSDVLGGVKEDNSASTKEVKDSTKKGKVKIEAKPLETGQKAGLFQFTGDENWDDTDEEDEDEEDGDEKDEKEKADDDDDFTLAWEILDYARVLFEKQLSPEAKAETETKVESGTTEPGSADAAGPEPAAELTEDEAYSLKVMLADTYDILGEVSLESESFAQAAKDLASALDLKLTLYPQESTLISEAHFKLSLALEFTAAADDVSPSDRAKGRDAAAEQMEKAIASCRARIAKEEAELGADKSGKGKGKEVVTKSLKDAREMVEELETRLVDLRTPETLPGQEKLEGLLGQLMGEDQVGAKKRIEEAMSKANDLTGLVRKKVKAEEPTPTPVPAPEKKEQEKVDIVVGESKGGKRKLDDLAEEAAPEDQSEKSEGESKKTKVETETEEK
ncbi:hypothetical protein DFP73DRAFT_161192 [Morchella snyderi]|nr:hypothetical protein DFP73DRAFT_161192 [Morchella snyderi]